MVHVKADTHYKVVHMELGGEDVIKCLACMFCDFFVSRSEFSKLRADGRHGSGLPRYNRMRAAMVRHLHQEHKIRLIFTEPEVK